MRYETDEIVAVTLSDEEIELVLAALTEWGGSANAKSSTAQAMGFANRNEFMSQKDQLAESIRKRESLSCRHWTQVLIATEIAFASDVLGSGVEWSIVTGLQDFESLRTLRTLQRRLVTVVTREILA